MRTYNNSIVIKFDTTATGNAGAGKPVTVYEAGKVTKAELFNAAEQTINNPINADDEGNYSFKVANGIYDIVIDQGLPTQVKIENELITDASGGGSGSSAIETIQLTSGQVLVQFTVNTEGASFYINGTGADNGRILEGVNYSYNQSLNQVTLTNSYPSGTYISAIRDTGYINEDYVRYFDELSDAVTSTKIADGDQISLKERTAGNDGGAIWDVYSAGAYPVDFDVIDSSTLPLQIKIRDTGALTVEAFGAGTADDTALFNFFVGKDYRPIANGDYNVTAIPSDVSMYRGYGKFTLPTGEKVPMGEDFKQVTLNAVRPIPDSDLSWVPFFPKVDSVGNVTTTEGVSNYARRVEIYTDAASPVWVSPEGSDANDGFSAGSPVETLNKALRTSIAYDIYMMGSDDPKNPNIFSKSDYRDIDAGAAGGRLKNVIVQGHCRIADPTDDLSSLTWTANASFGNVYEATTTSALINQLRYKKASDDDGGYLKIPSFTSVSDVNGSTFGFWHDVGNNILYVRIGTSAGSAFKADLYPIVSDAASRMLFLGTAILFYCPKGSSLSFDGVYLTPLVSESTRPRLYLHAEEPNGIEIKNTFTHGVDSLGAEYYAQNVKVTSTGGDNFHGFDSGVVSTLAVEVNCDSSYAGDFGTRGALAKGTDNGSAMHGTGHVARFGGKYYKNYGPDVVDSGSGAFWNCGVEAFGSTLAVNAIGFDVTAGAGRMYLDTCLARDEDLDEIQVNAGAVLRTFNTTGEVNEVSTGVEYAYDPLNPL